MLNRRQALIGYLAYTAGKPIIKRVVRSKAKSAVPGTREGSRAPNTAALVAVAAALLGALAFWRRRRSDEEPFES